VLVIATLTKKLLDKLTRKTYREAYVEENVRTWIAYQIRALREARGWSQKKLAEVLGKPQSVLSRIEDPDYGKLSIQTLLEVAAAFDVALLVQFADFPEFINRTEDVSPEALNRESYSVEQFAIKSSNWAAIQTEGLE
jgi:transcriptional regulator with XRE-family HTH domain